MVPRIDVRESPRKRGSAHSSEQGSQVCMNGCLAVNFPFLASHA